MAARYLYQGVNAAFTRNTGTVINSTSLASARDSTYVDCYVSCSSGSTCIMDFTDGDGVSDYAVAGEEFWYRYDWYYYSGSSTATTCCFLNDVDQQLFRLRLTSSGVIQVQYNTGTLAVPVWTQLGTNITHPDSTRRTYVVKMVIDAAGTDHQFEVYQGGVLVQSGVFPMAGLTEIHASSVQDISTSTGLSQVLATVGISLVGSFCGSVKATAIGNSSGMTGVFGNVSEVALSDATVVSSNTAAQRTTFTIGDLPALSGLVIGGEQRHMFRANNDGGAGPQNIKPVVRTGGVDTVGASVAGIYTGYKTFTAKLNLTYSEINTAGFELGWESAA